MRWLGRERTPDEEVSFRRRGYIKHYTGGPGRWTSTVKVIENHLGKAYIKIQQQFVVSGPLSPKAENGRQS